MLQGVHLTDLLPARAGLAVIDAHVIHLGFVRTRRFAASQLAPGSDLMVADTRQRGFTDRLSPLCVLVPLSNGDLAIVDDVSGITVEEHR
ncbi:MAG TPA: hypothetical protein VKE51_18725 [Vicinamibacterales bacterium]|nr:hypothetical protein [Vicinamibacterales bacterium]